MNHFKEETETLFNLKEPYWLCDVRLRAPWWTITDIWPKRHVYFVRHLRLCDVAKKMLIRRRILRIRRYFVQKMWVDYRLPMRWREALRIQIFLAGLHKKGKVPLLKYEIHSLQRKLLLAEAFLLYFPPLSRREDLDTLFFDETLKQKMLASLH